MKEATAEMTSLLNLRILKNLSVLALLICCVSACSARHGQNLDNPPLKRTIQFDHLATAKSQSEINEIAIPRGIQLRNLALATNFAPQALQGLVNELKIVTTPKVAGDASTAPLNKWIDLVETSTNKKCFHSEAHRVEQAAFTSLVNYTTDETIDINKRAKTLPLIAEWIVANTNNHEDFGSHISAMESWANKIDKTYGRPRVPQSGCAVKRL